MWTPPRLTLCCPFNSFWNKVWFTSNIIHCPERNNLSRSCYFQKKILKVEHQNVESCCWTDGRMKLGNKPQQIFLSLNVDLFQKAFSHGETTNLWHKMTTCLAYTLHFNTRGCLFPLPLCNISHFQNGEGQRGVGGGSTQRSAPHLPPPGEKCQGNDVAAVPLIPMKITGWRGGCHPRLLTRRQLQVIRARRRAAVVCGNCKLLLKSSGEWL